MNPKGRNALGFWALSLLIHPLRFEKISKSFLKNEENLQLRRNRQNEENTPGHSGLDWESQNLFRRASTPDKSPPRRENKRVPILLQ